VSNTRSHSSQSTLIRLTTGKHSQAWVWDGQTPLQLLSRSAQLTGWILENPPSGPRVRHLASNQVHNLQERAIRFAIGSTPIAFELSSTRSISAPLSPEDPSSRGTQVTLQHRYNDWIYKTETCSTSHALFSDGKRIAQIQVQGAQIEVRPEGTDLRATQGGSESTLTSARSFSLSSGALVLRSQTHAWQFALGGQGADLAPSHGKKESDDGFNRALLTSIGAVAALLLVIPMLPKQSAQEKEVIPEQFAKIVLTPQPQKVEPATAAAASSGAPGAATATATQKKTEVVQALRSKALQNSMSSLVKGGMSQLLAQSDFIAGKNTQAKSQALFQNKNAALEYTTTGVSGTTQNSVVVGALGGGAGSGSGGKGQAGYGQGVHAGITGQGKSLISLETAGAAVEDGLTKDEVGAVIHKHMSEVRYCYESAMIRTADLEGKLQIKFVINAQGVVSQADVQQSTLSDPRLDDCVVRRLVTWKFPQPKGGVNVTVSYPFLFKTLGR
jgi:TonB family protein